MFLKIFNFAQEYYQNAGNAISETQTSKIFRGGCPRTALKIRTQRVSLRYKNHRSAPGRRRDALYLFQRLLCWYNEMLQLYCIAKLPFAWPTDEMREILVLWQIKIEP